ncbi:glycoside hydrolase family 26 protein [Streptomyces polyrhachis]|uniref:Glycoside hydrolase family 26 protein n=1 Tax=Streptomyces polyrhachis TaxID=1282885 RepID=A0ABW2GPH5_9ACTN
MKIHGKPARSHPRRRSIARRAALFLGCAGLSVALAGGPSLAVDPDSPPARSTAAAPGSLPEGSDFGAYLHYGPPGLERMTQFSQWLGIPEMRVAHTYLPGDLWSNIEGLPGFLEPWARWKRAQPGRLFVLNVPMMARNEEKLSDDEVRRQLRYAAAGRFDVHFRRLAERLVELGIPDTVLVPGWEMNGQTYSHRCAPDPQRWKTYWRRMVHTMRAVPGQRLRFDFTPNRGLDAIPWTQCYPGDDVVDILGMDTYDQPQGITFDEQVSEPYGLRHHVEFARAHGKPFSYPEWGLFRNGDNMAYVLRMLAWIDEQRPLYHTLTDYCPHGLWQCTSHPRSAALFRVWMNQGGDAAPSGPALRP